MSNRYTFTAIFNYDPNLGVISPKYNLAINGFKFSQGSSITRNTFAGGLNLFNYIGRDVAGLWNEQDQTLNVLGFY